MEDKKKNVHQDHRKRMRTKYLKTGVDVTDDHNILEMLLYYAIPYKDTNPIAHELIDTYHNINGVLDASAKDLIKHEGIGENTAFLIKLVRDIISRYNENVAMKGICLASDKRLYDFARLKYVGETKEVVYMISVDSHDRMRSCIKIAEGSPSQAVADNRKLIELALRFDVTDVIIMHNHPGGFATPSQADINTTQMMAKLFATINVNFIDHIIVADGKCFSFASSKKYCAALGWFDMPV